MIPRLLCLPVFCITFTVLALSIQQASGQGSSLEAALPMIRQSGDTRALIASLSSAASQHLIAGNIDLASKRVDEAIALCRSTNNAQGLDYPLMVATNLLNKLGDDEAKKFLLGLLKAESGNGEMETKILRALSNALERSGEMVAAIQISHDRLQKLAQSKPGTSDEAWALQAYGILCIQGQMYDLGIPAIKKAKAIAIKLGNPVLAGTCDTHIAQACMRTNEFETAIEIYRQQYEEAKQSSDPTAIAVAQTGLAHTLVTTGDLAEAKTLIDQVVTEGTNSTGHFMSLQAVMAAQKADYKTAVEKCNQAINEKVKAYSPQMMNMMGDQAVMNDTLALAHYQSLIGDYESVAASLSRCETGYRQYLDSVKSAAAQGVVSMEATKTATSYIGSGISSIRQQVLVKKQLFEEALVESERGRGQTQAESMRANFGQEIGQAAQPLTIEAIRQLASQQNVTFVEYSLVHPLDENTRSLVPPKHPLRKPTQLFVWVVSPKGKVTFKSIPLRVDLDEMVKAFRSSIMPPRGENTPKSKPIAETGKALYDLLIAPIKSVLPTDPESEVVIIPQGELYAIPFVALPDPDGKDLIDSHTLTTSGSIDLYRLSVACHDPAATFEKHQILIVGNPTMPAYLSRPDKPASPLNPLPGSEAEAKAIANMFGIEPLIGAEATETKISQLMDSAEVIHLASHGLLESENAFDQSYLSAIALAPSDQDNGFLTVREIMRKKLQAELVVLSACDSGRGKITGEGVIGLSRAYLSAGVPTVVVSLWPVSDRATAILMVNFYKALGEGKSKSAALRSATLANRERFEAPNLWAPFTMYGIGR